MSAETGGPEWRNVIAGMTEREVRAFLEDFAGWTFLAANSDFCGRGLDLLFSYLDPYSGWPEGVVVDAKHVETGKTFTNSILFDKLEAVYEKIVTYTTCQSLWEDERVQGRIRRLKMGLTVMRFTNFDDDKYAETLANFDPKSIQASEKVSVMATLSNDRLAAFVGLRNFARNRYTLWQYFDYMENRTPRPSTVLSLPLMVSDLIPGVLASDEKMEPFILAFQSPTPEFFKFFPSFARHFQFTPDYFLFTDGEANQEEYYRQFMPSEYQQKKLHVLGIDTKLNVNLATMFARDSG